MEEEWGCEWRNGVGGVSGGQSGEVSGGPEWGGE